MADYVTLVGAEDVQRAAHSMRAAADDMKQSAEWIDGALARHQRFLDDWLDRFTAAIERLAPSAESPRG